VAFREGIHVFEWMITGNTGGLVEAAMELHGVRRALVPVVGGQ
jgi:hypothetical protein